MSTRSRPLSPTTVPTVTVVIPHFNYGDYLPTAVRTALEQPGVDVDVLIVDDASTDGTSIEVARALAASDDRVVLLEHQKNKRHIATYNDGLSRATGKYVVLLSADDALSPGSLARSTGLMEANPTVGLVYGHAQMFSEEVVEGGDAPTSWPGATESWTVWTGQEWAHEIAGRGRNLILNPEVIMRREIYDAIGGYDARFPYSADLYMWLRAAARADIGRVNGVVQAYYRVHDTNMHTTQFGDMLGDYAAVRDTFDTFLDEDGDLLESPDRLRRRARRALSREAIYRTALLPKDEPAESLSSLFEFSSESDPSDRVARRAYSSALRLRPLLRHAEKFRWRVRHFRELRRGI